MKKKEFEKFKNRSVAELTKDVAEQKEKLYQAKREISAGKTTNVRKAGAIRRDIARMLTLVNNKGSQK